LDVAVQSISKRIDSHDRPIAPLFRWRAKRKELVMRVSTAPGPEQLPEISTAVDADNLPLPRALFGSMQTSAPDLRAQRHKKSRTCRKPGCGKPYN
jgi:hypothetical protein